MAIFSIDANGTDAGEYHGETAAEALDVYAREAGYADYAEVIKEFGDDAVAIEINIEALCIAVSNDKNMIVFQDSYGSGIALVDGISYLTYQELAQSIGKNCWDFQA